MSGHQTSEKRKSESEKNRTVASSFRKPKSNDTAGGNGNARLEEQKRLDARREATVRGLMNATVAAIRNGNITDLGGDQPFPNTVFIDGGLRGYVDDDPAVDEPIDGFSSASGSHEAIDDPDTYTVFCSRQLHTAAERLLAKRGN